MLETFITVLAWIIVVPCTLIGVATLISATSYPGSLEELMDRVKGLRRTFHPWRFLIPALIAWAWLITGWVT